MDDHQRARRVKLMQRQARSRRTPAMLEAWRSHGVPAAALNDARTEHVIGWLRANWRQPDQHVEKLGPYLQLAIEAVDVVIVVDLWRWDEAVSVLVPAKGLLGLTHRLREIYPDGLLVVDQPMSRGLLIDFDDHDEGAEIVGIGAGLPVTKAEERRSAILPRAPDRS